jgi:hypothetical protein
MIVFFTKRRDDQTKEDETRRECSMHAVTDVYIILVREPEQRRPRDMRHRRHNNIKVDLKETGPVWTGSVWLRVWTSGRQL